MRLARLIHAPCNDNVKRGRQPIGVLQRGPVSIERQSHRTRVRVDSGRRTSSRWQLMAGTSRQDQDQRPSRDAGRGERGQCPHMPQGLTASLA